MLQFACESAEIWKGSALYLDSEYFKMLGSSWGNLLSQALNTCISFAI